MRVLLADPPAYTPPYDHALAAALAGAGAEVELWTSPFPYGDVPVAPGYVVRHAFGRHQPGRPASTLHRAARLAQHPAGMLALRRAARHADVTHLQWLPVPPLDARVLPPSPRVLTAHDVLPRTPRPGQLAGHRRLLGRMDAVVVHSEHGRGRLLDEVGLPPERVHVVPHGAFTHLREVPDAPLPPELDAGDHDPTAPVALLFGLLRPYKGLDVLLEAWRGLGDGELWIVGKPTGWSPPAHLPPRVRLVPRFVSDAESAAVLRRADLVVLPYREIDQSGVLYGALGLGRPLLLSAVGGFPEVAATGAAELVPPGDPTALRDGLHRLLADPAARDRLAAAATAAAEGPYAWPAIAERTLAVYRGLRPG